jgi:hypothetical protein
VLFSSLLFLDSAQDGGAFTVPLGFFESELGEKYHYLTFPIDASKEPEIFTTDYPYYRAAALSSFFGAGGLEEEEEEE